jgi:hypothetical protein
MGSDHFPLFISLNAKINEDQNSPKQEKFNYEKEDWSTFYTLCQDITYEEVYSNDINIFLKNLTDKKMNMAGLAKPTFTPRSGKHKSVPWWNENCQKAVQERKKAINKFFKNPSPGNLTTYEIAEANCKLIILESKKEN